MTSRPSRSPASSEVDTRPLRGLPGNIGHESDPFGVLLPSIAGGNAEALVLSATGRDLDADLVVSSGHLHDDGDSRILWHQLASVDLVEAAFGSNFEGAVVDSTTADTLVLLPLFLPLDNRYPRLLIRVRVSLPSEGSATTPTLYLRFTLLRASDLGDFYGTQKNITLQHTQDISHEWREVALEPLSVSDLGDSAGHVALHVQGSIETAGQEATVWEVQVVAI